MRHMGRLALASLLAGGLALGVAEAQKPPPAGTPAPPSTTPAPAPPPAQGPAVPGKPPAGAAPTTPPPAQGAPGTQTPGAPAPQTPGAPAPQTPGAPAPQTPGAPAPQTPGAPAPRAQAPNVPAPIDEPTAVGRLRSLLGADITLAYARAEVTDPARGTVRLSGVTMTSAGKPLRIETLALDDLRDDGLGEAEARNLSFQDGDNTFTLERAQIAGLTVRAAAAGQPRTPDLVTLDSLRVAGLLVRGGRDNEVRLGQAALEDYGPGRQTRFSMSDLAVRTRANEPLRGLTMRRAVLRGMDIATVATTLARGQQPPLSGRLALEMEEVTATGPDNGALGSIGSLRLVSDQPAEGIGTGSFALRALRVNPIGEAAPWMQRLGYGFLLFDLTADSRYDPATGRMELPSMSLVGRDMGTLSLAFTGDGASTAAMQRGSFEGLRLISAGLRYIDQGLVGRVLGQQARESNTPEAQLREQYANMAGGLLAQPALAQVREAVQRFIRGQAREIEVTLHPTQPVALMELQQRPPSNPADAVARLGLGAVAR